MDENKEMKNEVNNMNESNNNIETKGKNKKLTIALVVVIILLLLAIGGCIGLWFSKGTINIINSKEEISNENDENNGNNENNGQDTDFKEGNTIEDTPDLEEEIKIRPVRKLEISDKDLAYIVAGKKDFTNGRNFTTEEYLEYAYIALWNLDLEFEQYDQNGIQENDISSIIYTVFGVKLQEHKSINVLEYKNGKYSLNGGDGGAQILELRNIKTDVAAGTKYLTYDCYLKSYVTGEERYVSTEEVAISGIDGTVMYKKTLVDKKEYINKTITNEYGDCTKNMVVYGKDFITIAGHSGRGYMYYINENNQLCRIDLVDLKTQILASDVKNIEIDQEDIIHAYPIGDSFMNNIAMDDEYVKFENIN